MTGFERHTHKLYYEDPYLRRCDARVTARGTDYVELDATVVYPEGGGQEADHGSVQLPNGDRLRIVGAKKMYTRMAYLPAFPALQTEGVIWHLIHPEDAPLLATLAPGTAVSVEIDLSRRARLSLSHSASHFLYVAVGLHRPDATGATLGCHIKTDAARFDFAVQSRFSADEIVAIAASANGFVERDAAIQLQAHPQVADARTWHCENHEIPCGGTHIEHGRPVGRLHVQRKNLGAGKERLSCTFPDAVFDLTRYHG